MQPLDLDIDTTPSKVLYQNINDKPSEMVVSGGRQTVTTATQTEYSRSKQRHRTLRVAAIDKEHDEGSLCVQPPSLYYSSLVEQQQVNEPDQYRVLDMESLRVEDLDLGNEETQVPATDHRRRPSQDVVMESRGREERGQHQPQQTASILEEALRPLPLLNTLLVELAQLSGQSQTQLQQLFSVHPNLAWIYRPMTEPSNGQADWPQSQGLRDTTTSPPRDRQSPCPVVTKLWVGPSPRVKNRPLQEQCTSTPQSSSRKTNWENTMSGNTVSKSSPKKKLCFGMTKTFRLRMKQVKPCGMKCHVHECRKQLTDRQTLRTKGPGRKSNNTDSQTDKQIDGRKLLNRNAILIENIVTLISSMDRDCGRQGNISTRTQQELTNTFTTSEKNAEHFYCKRDDSSQRLPKQKPSSHSKQDSHSKLWVHIPSVDHTEEMLQSGEYDHADSDSRGDGDETPRGPKPRPHLSDSGHKPQKSDTKKSPRHEHPHSASSSDSLDSVRAVEYLDDFSSLDSTDGDGYSPSPDLLRSPEPVGGGTRDKRRSQVSGDHNSDSSSVSERSQRRRGAPPLPVKAETSPQRSLMNTHVIRPRTQVSALGVSSDKYCSSTQLAAIPYSGGAMRSGSGARGTSTNRPAGTWSRGAKGSFSVSESLRASSQLSDIHTGYILKEPKDRAPDRGYSVNTHTDSIHTKNSRPDRGYSVNTHTDSIHTKNSRPDRGYSVNTHTDSIHTKNSRPDRGYSVNTHTDSIHTKNSRPDRGYSVNTHTDSIHTKNSRPDRGYSVNTCISTDYNSSPESHKAEEIEEELTEERGEELSEEAGEELSEEAGEELSEEAGEELSEEAGEELSEERGEELAEEAGEELAEEAGEELAEEAGEELSEEAGEELAEEAIDELGSLGLSIEYQHVSELVVNKLPGYTL